jgi:hypothetical protein
MQYYVYKYYHYHYDSVHPSHHQFQEILVPTIGQTFHFHEIVQESLIVNVMGIETCMAMTILPLHPCLHLRLAVLHK